MYLGLYKPARVVEERGDDYFVAAHPEPRKTPPSIVSMVLGARHSLIGNWTEDDYRSGVDSFRILNRQLVLVNSPEWVRYVMATAHHNYERKSPQMRRALEGLLGDGLFISDGPTWAARRPLVADIVHKKRVPEFAPTIEEITVAKADQWREMPPGEEFNIVSEMAALTAEIIAKTVFGRNLGGEAANRVVNGFSRYQKTIDSFNLGYFLGLDEGWKVRLGPGKRRAIRMVHAVVDDVITAHLDGHGDAGSMVDLLLRRNARNPESALDVTALRNEAATIFMAGHETTATTLAWAWYLLDNAPWVRSAMLTEIDTVCGDRTPTLEDLPRLDWCKSVIQETLRLYPPVPLLPRQARDADRIGAVDVEKGALVMIAPWLLHRARDLWDRPNHFLPERFLNDARIEPYTFIPFSVGPRICAGLNFGLSEAILCLAILAQRFSIRVRPGYRVEPVCRLTLRPNGGLPVTIEPRRWASVSGAAA
ncbi:cytochrome P450 [Segnochrobactrum spirostomi]|uniref:Cytochrome P450 n=1 Tax=Segnochrobactrum spirostomi TaxID=2608987 RepID=A0A6A7Y7F1_9HYPH|nr:cytochrome P450 [Segnochrobactrum spirostomi]MQT15183.1 cytochrome P450 [Segnochrobactrum spirostomi]